MGIAGADRRGRERLLRYSARPPFAGKRVECIDAERVRYRLPKPRPDGRTELILSPPRLIERVAALVRPPRRDRLRYYGAHGEVMDREANVAGIDPLAQPEPEYIFDQRIAW